MSLLDVRDLEVRYGGIQAVRGISLTVGEGELVSLIGANGAGKTTTLKAVSNLLRAERGDSSVIWVQEQVVRPKLIQLFTHALAFVCPSIYEPLGIVNLEAMACGVGRSSTCKASPTCTRAAGLVTGWPRICTAPSAISCCR